MDNQIIQDSFPGDERSVFIEQPAAFRDVPLVPEWVYFPLLQTLFGWGDGIRDTLRGAGTPSIDGIRFVFAPVNAIKNDNVSSTFMPVAHLLRYQEAHRAKSPENAGLTPLRLYGYDRNGAYMLSESSLSAGIFSSMSLNHVKEAVTLTTDGSHRVRFSPEVSGVTLERRIKMFNLKYVGLLEEFGLTFDGEAGEIVPLPDRTPDQRGFGIRVRQLKDTYVEGRTFTLLNAPNERPANFNDVHAATLRSEYGKKTSGKRANDGGLRTPKTEKELLVQTCVKIARLESSMLVFRQEHVPVCNFNHDGLSD